MSFHGVLRLLPVKRFRDPPPVVGVIRLAGVLAPGESPLRRGPLNLNGMARTIERAFRLANCRAVALAVNSPGGSPVQSALIAGRIRALAVEKQIPVYAFAEDVAASGGYWVACAADEIYADANSIVGSIGVISAGFGFQELLGRHGIERRIHSAGERKSLLDPFQSEKPADVARLKGVQDEIHQAFKAYVGERRAGKLSGPPEELFSGEFWTGTRALELGLIDGIGDLREVMRNKYGKDVKLVSVGERRSWLGRRLGFGRGSGGVDWASPGLAASMGGDLVGAVLEAIEERAFWNRFGL